MSEPVTIYRPDKDDLGNEWTCYLTKNGGHSSFWERDHLGVKHNYRDCGEFEAERLYNEWHPPQSAKLDFGQEDGS
jgi:hypothetical protein